MTSPFAYVRSGVISQLLIVPPVAASTLVLVKSTTANELADPACAVIASVSGLPCVQSDAGFACTLAFMNTHPWLDRPETFSNPSTIGCAVARGQMTMARQTAGNN